MNRPLLGPSEKAEVASERLSGGPSLRERKKAATRQTILATAATLFEQRGYDNVTVAEIAEAANVSVKTLFVYFRSKEDLVFADTSLIDTLVKAIGTRPATASPAQAVAGALVGLMTANDGADVDIEGFHRGFGTSGELRSPLLRMWATYEDRIVDALARSAAQPDPTPAMRLTAITLVGILRTLTSPEIRSLLAGDDATTQRDILVTWVIEAASRVDNA
jgi:AcrR family transcriptional regulator